MLSIFKKLALLALVGILAAPTSPAPLQKSKKPKKEEQPQPKEVWNFDGGIYFETDGAAQEETCFRLIGHITAPDFFTGLRRFDTNHGTEFRRGNDVVTEFPEKLTLTFTIADFPCPDQLNTIGERTYLSREMMSNIHLAFFWKNGIALRPVEHVTREAAQIVKVEPYNREVANTLPDRFRWSFELSIPSEGVPVTDSLVLILRTQHNGRIAARVAARL